MPDVQFEDENQSSSYLQPHQQMQVGAIPKEVSNSFMVRMLMKWKIASTPKAANNILFGISIICLFLTTCFGLYRLFFSDIGKRVTYKEDIPVEVFNSLPPQVQKSIPSRNK